MQIFRRVLFGVLLALLLGGGIWFGVRNGEQVQVDLLFGEPVTGALWIFLLGALALGAVLAALAQLPALLRGGVALYRARRKLRELESEVHQLRNLPLEGADAVPGEHARGREASA